MLNPKGSKNWSYLDFQLARLERDIGGIRNNFIRLISEIFRWTLIAGLTVIVFSWIGLALGIGWSIRFINSVWKSLLVYSPSTRVGSNGVGLLIAVTHRC